MDKATINRYRRQIDDSTRNMLFYLKQRNYIAAESAFNQTVENMLKLEAAYAHNERPTCERCATRNNKHDADMGVYWCLECDDQVKAVPTFNEYDEISRTTSGGMVKDTVTGEVTFPDPTLDEILRADGILR